MNAPQSKLPMSQITLALFVALGVYLALLLSGQISGNFSLLLLILTVVTGLYWLAERFYFAPQRQLAAQRLVEAERERQAKAAAQGIKLDAVDTDQLRAELLRQPWWIEWTAGLFGVIAIVFLLRSFVAEPFRVPSGSMLPTIAIGDLILVNKFTYGVRLPVANVKLLANNDPQRGDIMVFRLPKDPRVDYIKRVVGVPGDTVAYRNKRLSINGVELSKQPLPDYLNEDSLVYLRQFDEQLGSVRHRILNNDRVDGAIAAAEDFPHREACNYTADGVVCKVPPGHYFMMGDNRDDSLDSRYWGFVPDANIVGKAFFVWFNFKDLKRIGPLR
jgi:signal peptidase I